MTPYCTKRVDHLSPGAACPQCGHTSLIHPYSGNPGVDHCGLCEGEHLNGLLRQALDDLGRSA